WTKGEGAGGKGRGGRGPAGRRHAGDPSRLDAAIRPHAVDERQALADLVLSDGEHAALLLEGQGGDLGGMRVNGDGRDPLGRCDVPQMRAEAPFIDRKVVVERQQHGRNDTMRDVAGVTGHGLTPRLSPSPRRTYSMWARDKSQGRGLALMYAEGWA